MSDKDNSAGKKNNRGSGSIKYDEIVEALIPDPAERPDATPIIGFIGKGQADDCIRVYVDRKFNSYFEINREDILFQQSLDELTKGQGGSIIWVHRTAQVTVTRAQSQTLEAEFLRGPVISGYNNGSVPSFQSEAVRAAKLAVTDWFCNSGEQWLWCTGAWFKDCTNDTYRRTKRHVTEHVKCKDGCVLTF